MVCKQASLHVQKRLVEALQDTVTQTGSEIRIQALLCTIQALHDTLTQTKTKIDIVAQRGIEIRV